MLRKTLIGLHSFVAVGALGGGVWGVFFPHRMPVDDWFKRGPFSSSVIPGLILLLVVGGSCWTAAVSLLQRRPFAWLLSLASGVILMVWIVVQVLIIGGGHFLQYLYFGLGGLIAGLSALGRATDAGAVTDAGATTDAAGGTAQRGVAAGTTVTGDVA